MRFMRERYVRREEVEVVEADAKVDFTDTGLPSSLLYDIKDLLACFDGRKFNIRAARLKGFAGIKIIKDRKESCGNVDYTIWAVVQAPTRKLHHASWKIAFATQQSDLKSADAYRIVFLKLLKKLYSEGQEMRPQRRDILRGHKDEQDTILEKRLLRTEGDS